MELDTLLVKHNYDPDKIIKNNPKYTKEEITQRIKKIKSYQKILKQLLTIPKIEQKSDEWYKARHKVVTVSDAAQAIGEGKFGTQAEFIIKKVDPPEFGVTDNPFFNHGNMFEQVANDIYAKMHNLKMHEFGLILHPKVDFIGASPDAISELGVMLEIKCPLRRKIIPGADPPKQYYYQIQGQLDVCDLEECDYFECELALCKSYWEFEASSQTKGVFAKENNQYIYGPLVLASPDQDLSEIEAFAQEHTNNLYWILKSYNLKRVYRDKQLIKEIYTEVKKVWEKVLFYRKNRDAYKAEVLNQIEIETELANLPEVVLPKFAFIDLDTN